MPRRGSEPGLVWHEGGCHCGEVKFEVRAPVAIEVHGCNCSICRRLGYLHLIVPRSCFRLIRGEDRLASYRFHTRVAEHLFCEVCGVKSFYVPRSHPEGISVNARCVDDSALRSIVIKPFDGANWEEHAAELPPLPESEPGG